MFTIIGADGKEYGPVTAARIAEWIASGRANLQTKARRVGETEWRMLGDYVEFNPAAVQPPPLVMPAPPEAGAPSAAVGPVLVPAGRGARFGAALVEGCLQMLCKLPILLALLEMVKEIAKDPNGARPEQFSATVMAGYTTTLPFLGLYAVIQITLLCVRSQSIGKLLFGLQIVDVNTGQPGGPLRAFVLRSFPIVVIEMIPLLGFVFWVVDSCFIFREDHRCLHDLMAGTVVVRK